MKSYDIAIIGAGPCGLTSALYLSKYFKVCVIEYGKDTSKRKCNLDKNKICDKSCSPCNVISGYGGCQFFDGTKACYYPAASNLLKFKSKHEVINYYDQIEKLLIELGKPTRKKIYLSKIKKIEKEFSKKNIYVKYYDAQKISKEKMDEIGEKIKRKLQQNDVKFLFENKVNCIKREKKFIIETPKNKITADKVIIATGRLGTEFLNTISEQLKINYKKEENIIEIGVRIEMPYKVFNCIDNIFNDIKLKRKIDNNNEIRTFCQNYKGVVRKCVFDNGISSLDGAILDSNRYDTNSINIAIHHRIGNLNDIREYRQMISKISNNNKPIVQNMESFLNNTKDYEINEQYCTMKSYSLGNINDYLPDETLKYIKEMIYDIDKCIPGFANKKNIVYAPSFELGSNKYLLNDNLETNIKNLYIGGDACGYFRGFMQAMISGKIISDSILEGVKNEK